MRIFGFQITRSSKTPVTQAKSLGMDLITRLPPARGWWPVIRESFAGAWQRSIVAPVSDVMSHSTAWACITLIASDIAKMRVTLVSEDEDGIRSETTNPAYTPVLRRPNHYQNRISFFLNWILSKLTHGNTYVLKERDARGVVCALYVLDPSRVQVMVAPSGQVFYYLQQDFLADLPEASVVVPAAEIIHDVMIPLYHPLVGVSPIYACGRAAMQALKMMHASEKFFEHGSQPGGVLSAPGTISNEVAERVQKHWDDNFAGGQNIGKVAVLGDGLTYHPMQMTAVDAQLIQQLQWSDDRICSVFHVPQYMIAGDKEPRGFTVEALTQQYYCQCLQILIESLELCLTEGLELNAPYSIECDLDGLLRMDSETKMKTATEGIVGGILTPNEGRARFNLPPVAGGDTPYLQQQNWSLAALDRRDTAPPTPPVVPGAIPGAVPGAPAVPGSPVPPAVPAPVDEPIDPSVQADFHGELLQKLVETDWTELSDAA